MSFRATSGTVTWGSGGTLPALTEIKPFTMDAKVYIPSTSFNPTPVVLQLPPDTTAKEIVQEVSKKCNIQGEELSLVIPSSLESNGGVVDPRIPIKSFHLASEV